MPVIGIRAPGTLSRRLAFERRHPGVTITPPGQTRSGQWEAAWAGQGEPVRRRTCPGLLTDLEHRFGCADMTGAAG